MVINNKLTDLSIIRVALEQASFTDYKIRDGITEVLNCVQADFDDLQLESGRKTLEAFAALETILNEVESPTRDKSPLVLDLVEVEGVNTMHVISDDEDETTNVVNVDDELDEFDKP